MTLAQAYLIHQTTNRTLPTGLIDYIHRCGNLGTCADHRCWLHSGTEAALRRRLAYRERHHHPDWRRPLPAPPVFPPIPRLTKAYLGLVFTAVEDLTA